MAAAESPLLFGLIALQVGLIDQSQLVAAFQAWVRDRSRTLADHLADRGGIDADARAAVDAMVALHLKKHGGDAEKSLAAIPAGRSTRERLAGLGDAELTGDVARLGSGSTEPDLERTMTYAVGATTSDGQRFRVLRPHARGGLGAVFVALDGELHREVALKQILDGHADDPDSRRRFLMEAEITGGLEHPGIVPVYGLGTYGDGRPYYAMRFIRGDSLKEAIEHYHADKELQQAPGRRSLELRKLLRRFLDVCNAIGYAHGRGVLHRDIKPGNIIVGKHGETLVVDWGLAKARGRDDVARGGDEAPLLPSSASGSSETLPGQALGTPAYMSPEQARGDLDSLGPASDVYALGATLYCLLTGRAPFEGGAGDVLRAVQRGEFRPPRQVNPSVDPPLDAICRKAMALDPTRRYVSVRPLAEDIERWMADEPVSAYREPMTRRAGRWARRHRTEVAAALALLVAGVAGLVANSVLVNRQRARAEANFALARRAVDDMYTQVAEKWLAQEPQMEPLQREFLLKALAFYERFARPDDPSPELRREAGKAARRVGEIQQKLGQNAAADSAFRRSRQILEGLPGDPKAVQELATTENRRGWLLWTLGKSPDEAFRRAMALGTTLIHRTPPLPESRKELARVYSSQGLVHAGFGRFAEAEAAHRQSLVLREALVRDAPAVAEYRQDVARSLANLAAVLRQTGRLAGADAASARAVELGEALVRETPRDPHFRADLAHELAERAQVLLMLGRRKEAESLLVRAGDLAGRLANDFPSFLEYQVLHAVIRRDLAMRFGKAEQPEDARGDLARAITVVEAMVRKNPDMPSYRRALAVNHANLADLWHSAGKPAEAEREFREALRLAEALAAEQPGLLDYRALRVAYQSSIAFLLRATGRYAESESAYDGVVAELEALHREFPGLPQFRASLAAACRQRGDLLGLLGRPRESAASLERAVTLAEELASEIPGVPSYHEVAAQALVSLAEHSLGRGETDAGRRFHERAIPHIESALASNAEGSANRYLLARTAAALAQIEARRGDGQAVDAAARRIESLARLPIEHYNAACFLSLIAATVRDGKFPEASREALVRSLADRAMAHLTRAVDQGYRNLGLIEKDADLDLLRPRADFRALLDRLPAETRSRKQ